MPGTILEATRTSGWADQLKAVIERAGATALPDPLPLWVERYSKVGPRSPFLWHWVVRGLDITTLSCVAPEHRSSVLATRGLGVMLDVLLDDLADRWQDAALLEEALASVTGGKRSMSGSGRFVAYLALTAAVWDEIQRRLREYPRYEEFEPVLAYDYAQLFNTMRYALLVNQRPAMLNMIENEIYQPHNMHMMVSSTIDLMASPTFAAHEHGLLREVVWRAQRMGRIGNQISTWEREIKDRDYTSEVFPYALQRGILELDLLNRGSIEEVADRLRAREVESHFLSEWQQLHDELIDFAPLLHSVDVISLVEGLEELIKLHLGSKGLK